MRVCVQVLLLVFPAGITANKNNTNSLSISFSRGNLTVIDLSLLHNASD